MTLLAMRGAEHAAVVVLPATTFGDLNFLAVSRDGSQFYIPQAVEQPESDVIHVRMGWAK